MIKFINQSYEEFQKVTWPTKEEAMRLTIYVIGVSLFVGLFVAAVDFMFAEALLIIL